MMHVPINVKSPNNTSKWQMGLNSAFKGLNTSSEIIEFYRCHFIRFSVKKLNLLLHTPQRLMEKVAALLSQKRPYNLFSEKLDGS
jgi:hypothetical protein